MSKVNKFGLVILMMMNIIDMIWRELINCSSLYSTDRARDEEIRMTDVEDITEQIVKQKLK